MPPAAVGAPLLVGRPHRLRPNAVVESRAHDFEGKGVTEAGARAKKAAEEIRALWAFLDRRAKQLGVGKAKTRVREAAKS